MKRPKEPTMTTYNLEDDADPARGVTEDEADCEAAWYDELNRGYAKDRI